MISAAVPGYGIKNQPWAKNSIEEEPSDYANAEVGNDLPPDHIYVDAAKW